MKSAAGQDPSRLTLSGEIHLRKEELGLISLPGTQDRRAKSRLKEAFPTRAWGTDAEGQLFEVDCVLDNISSTGLYLRIPKAMKSGADLSLVIKFSNGNGNGASAILLGQILRAEPQADGHHGLALAIREHHFL
jgi:hypothetical protein